MPTRSVGELPGKTCGAVADGRRGQTITRRTPPPGLSRGRDGRGDLMKNCYAAFFTSIVFFIAGAALGSVTVNTPLANSALILSLSTPSGTTNERWNAP